MKIFYFVLFLAIVGTTICAKNKVKSEFCFTISIKSLMYNNSPSENKKKFPKCENNGIRSKKTLNFKTGDHYVRTFEVQRLTTYDRLKDTRIRENIRSFFFKFIRE